MRNTKKSFGKGLSEEEFADKYQKYYEKNENMGKSILSPDSWRKYYDKGKKVSESAKKKREDYREYMKKVSEYGDKYVKALKESDTSRDPDLPDEFVSDPKAEYMDLSDSVSSTDIDNPYYEDYTYDTGDLDYVPDIDEENIEDYYDIPTSGKTEVDPILIRDLVSLIDKSREGDINYPDLPSVKPVAEDEFYFEPKYYSDSEGEDIDVSKLDIEDEGFIPDKRDNLTIYRKSIPKRGNINLGDTSTTNYREYPDMYDTALTDSEIDSDVDSDVEEPDYSMFTKGSESNLDIYNPPVDEYISVYGEHPAYEFKPISDPLTLSVTEAKTIGDKIKPDNYIRPITYQEAITINPKDDKYTDIGYDFLNRPELIDTNRGKVSDLYQERKGYTNEVQDEINLLSIKKDNTQIIGSASYAVSSRYASDLDLFENVDVCCSKEDASQVFFTGIQKIVNNVLRAKYHWFIEVKVGLDLRYPDYVGFMKNSIYHIDPNFKNTVNNLILNHLLYDDEVDTINRIFKKNKPNQLDFEIIMKIMREHRVLRWTAEEILTAYKLLPGGQSINLRDAIPQKSQINIEVAAIVEGKLIQVSNFFILSYHSKNSKKRYVINLPQESVDNIEEFFVDNLKKNIYLLLKSKLKYEPLKAAKRMFSLSRYNALAVGRNDRLGDKVIDLLTSKYALAGQIKSEIGVMLILLENLKVTNFPYVVVSHQLESYRSVVSSFTDMKKIYVTEILTKLLHSSTLLKTYNYLTNEEKATLISLLEDISSLLSEYSNAGAERYLKKKKLIPLPKNLMPKVEDRIYN